MQHFSDVATLISNIIYADELNLTKLTLINLNVLFLKDPYAE